MVPIWTIVFFHKGRVVVVIITGMKVAGSTYKLALRQLIRYLVLTVCRDDVDVWMRFTADILELGATADDGIPSGEWYY